jgi:hypothetical protein
VPYYHNNPEPVEAGGQGGICPPNILGQKTTCTATYIQGRSLARHPCIYIYYLPTQILVASTGSATNMMYLVCNGVAEHICSVPLTEMYFLCCTQQLAHTNGQLISKCPFGVFKSPKKPRNFFPGFLS